MRDVVNRERPGLPGAWLTMTLPRFLLDEHVPQAIQSQLLQLDAEGVLLLRRGASLGQVIEQLYLLWIPSDAEEYVDRLLYLPM